MIRDALGRLLGRLGIGQAGVDYEESKRIASDPDPKVRLRLAGRADARPEVLYYLAEDETAEVRAAIAHNAKTPWKADRLLAKDQDEDVRAALAGKIGRLVPNLPADAKAKVRDRVFEVLRILVEDQLPRVRRILAEELKQAEAAPKDVIDRLARDRELTVAAPILQYSPLLSDQDLLDIINSAPVQGALTAIARRGSVSEPVADRIVAAEDVPAVAALLGNASAQIREETLDRIVERAPTVGHWHEPLVLRRQLPARLIKRVAGFVTSSLLNILAARDDLDATTAVELAFLVKERLATEAETVGSNAASKAAEQYAKGRLGEAEVLAAIEAGNQAFVIHALSLKSGLDVPVVHKILDSGSGKAVVSLVWRAGFGMAMATTLQHRMARVPPGAIVHPKNGTEFPLSENDMNWYASFYES